MTVFRVEVTIKGMLSDHHVRSNAVSILQGCCVKLMLTVLLTNVSALDSLEQKITLYSH